MIEVEQITKRFGSRLAVSDLSFTAANGRVTGFVGPNGAGKSTTMRCIIGLDTPDAGRAAIDGQGYAALDRPVTRVGALLDPTWVHPGRSARNHLRWLAATAGLPAGRADAVLDRVGLTEVAREPVGRFSLGMRQRLGLAAALIGDPDNLILDEPLNGLDPDGVRWARGVIRDFAECGGAVLISSHLLSELSLVADSVVLIGNGTLLGHETVVDLVARSGGGVLVRVDRPEELRRVAAAHDWRLQPPPRGAEPGTFEVHGLDLDTDAVGRALGAAGATVLELTKQSGSLEEAVMGLTRGHVEYAAKEADR